MKYLNSQVKNDLIRRIRSIEKKRKKQKKPHAVHLMMVWEVILDFLERFSKHRAHSLSEFEPYRVISLGVSKRFSNMYIFFLAIIHNIDFY